jgi:hypothetical protein
MATDQQLKSDVEMEPRWAAPGVSTVDELITIS